jgi:hypothetical protein
MIPTEVALISVSHLFHVFVAERRRAPTDPFFQQSLDELIWVTCIQGGPPAWTTPTAAYLDLTMRYMKIYRSVLTSQLPIEETVWYHPQTLLGDILVLRSILGQQPKRKKP